jgi:undecaprenyl-diphosphatase
MQLRLRDCWQWLLALDSQLCVQVSHTSQYKLVKHVFRCVSRLGDGVFWYTLMGLIALFDREHGVYVCFHMMTAGLTGTIIYKLLKHKTHRPRPYQVRQDVLLNGIPLDKFSFPSGHTLHAVAMGLVAMAYYPVLSVLVMPFIILVGMSRVVLGLHYPTDVLAGAAVGYGIVVAYAPFF